MEFSFDGTGRQPPSPAEHFRMMTMVNHTMLPDVCQAVDAVRLRAQADDLLRRLIDARRLSEERSVETGRRDPMKFVTGRSCLDEAIATTHRMIAEMDDLLANLERELDLAEPRKADFTPHVLGAVG